MKKWFNSFKHAIRGLIVFFQTERNARIELSFAFLALLLCQWLQVSRHEFYIVLLCIAGVLSAEAFNSVVERLADLQQPRPDPRIKMIKDMSAGAVLLLAFTSLITGILIFGPKLLTVFGLD